MLIAFMFVCIAVGGADRGRLVREHPLLLMGFTTAVAASFYLLRVVT